MNKEVRCEEDEEDEDSDEDWINSVGALFDSSTKPNNLWAFNIEENWNFQRT